MQSRVLKLGTTCRDKATRLSGTLTHWIMNMDGKVDYLFQPRGLNEEGQPLKKLFLCEARLDVCAGDFEHIEVPFEILGTEVTDKASGFTGMAVQFVRHINGCFHVDIQPPGTIPRKGTAITSNEFDLRGCTGKKIPNLTEPERKKSEQQRPSPASHPERPPYDSVPLAHR